MRHVLLTAAMTAATMLAGTAQAGFIGSTVSSTLTTNFTVTMPFASAAIVGDGYEFTAAVIDEARQNWSPRVDITDTTVIIEFASGRLANNIRDQGLDEAIFEITLSGLPNLASGLALTSYECRSTEWLCSFPYFPSNGLFYTSFSDNSFTAAFHAIRSGDRYVFGIVPSQHVPEPGALGLLGVGLVGAGLARRRSRHNGRTA